jgi:hypothetical protein
VRKQRLQNPIATDLELSKTPDAPPGADMTSVGVKKQREQIAALSLSGLVLVSWWRTQSLRTGLPSDCLLKQGENRFLVAKAALLDRRNVESFVKSGA